MKVNALEQRLDRVERRSAAAEARVSADGGTVTEGEPPPSMERFVSLTSPHPAVRVEQLPNGAYAAHNTDPTLTGQVLVVEGRRADGTTEKITITVPPPGK